jgi:dienelactone hydrolase
MSEREPGAEAPLHEVPFRIENRRGDAVYGDVRFRPSGAPRPVVVVCHGFKGFKDWGMFPEWGRTLARAGFVSVTFNFSYNGVTPEHPTAFTRLDRFAENTLTRELDDLDAVLAAVAEGRLPEAPVDPARIGLTGHSRGGGIALLQAAGDERVRALATWNAVSCFFERFTPGQIDRWERQGYVEVVNARTGQVMRLNRTLYDDALAHRERLDVRAAAARMAVPWLLVHARDDRAVPFSEAEALHAAAPHARLFEASGGHTFGSRHPCTGPLPPSLREVFENTRSFFRKNL